MKRNGSLRERLGKATLENLYNGIGLSSAVIAERYGSKPATVRKLMDEYGLPRRARTKKM